MSNDLWKKKVDIFRSRFVAREDVFSTRKPYTVSVTDPETGAITLEEHSTIMPACANYGNQKLCLITQKKGGCKACEHQAHKPLTDGVVWDHISGKQELIMYMLMEGGVRFGVVDFDRGTTFEDAIGIRNLSVACGLHAYIAKSTKKGYHVYWFFSDFIKPFEFTSFTRYLFEELGFYQRAKVEPQIGIPETFPKQTIYNDGKTGNGIKVPMMETRVREGRNCWVTDEGVPITAEDQWDYLAGTSVNLAEDFRRVLVEKNVEILQAPASKDRQTARKAEGREAGDAGPQKTFGDFWNVVEGCPAMKQFWTKDADGGFTSDKVFQGGNIPYEAYLASMMIANSTVNGVEEIKKRWPDNTTKYQTDYAAESSYAPMSCVTMQQKGICLVGKHPKCGDHCMKKLAPVAFIEGKKIINPDGLPEDQWPDPSPIRYATDKNLTPDEIYEKLAALFKGLEEKIKFPYDPGQRIEGILTGALKYLEKKDWETLRAKIRANKLMLEKELKAFEKRANKEVDAAVSAKARSSGKKNFKFGSNEFFEHTDDADCGYYRVWYDAKGIRQEERITNFRVVIHEEIVAIRINEKDDLSTQTAAEDRSFTGTVFVEGGGKYPLPQMNYRDWSTAASFFKEIVKCVGTGLKYTSTQYDNIRNCIGEFSKEHLIVRKTSRQIGYHLLKGRTVYMMPSVIVDKDSVCKNDEFAIEAFKDDTSSCLDFIALGEDEFKNLATHIVDDYLTCNSSILTYTTFAHAMSAVLLPQVADAVGFNKSPVLWLAGNMSGGKTFVAEAAQNFFGRFEFLQSASGTSKSKLSAGHDFRHSFMLIDDYKKALNDQWGKEFPQLIQTAYDRSSRPALQRNGERRERADRIRGLIAITAEDPIESESSSASRVILVDVPFKEGWEAGGRVKKRRTEYSGFTPYFIQFVLSLSREEIRDVWDSSYNSFYEEVAESQKKNGAARVSENLSLNMVAFTLAMDMLVARGVISDVRRSELCRTHLINLKMVRGAIFESVTSASGSRVFLDGLKELIQNPNRCYVSNWPGHDGIGADQRGNIIGFYRSKTPDVIYILPSAAHGMVADHVRKNNNRVQSMPHIARQLYDEELLIRDKIDRNKGTYAVQIRGPEGNTVRVWPLKLAALGLEVPKSKDNKKGGDNILPLDPDYNPKAGGDT